MRKITLLIIFIISLSSCDSEKTAKTSTFTDYKAIKTNDNWNKGDIERKYEVGFYENGSQKYFVGLVGYGNNNDTTFHDKLDMSSKRKVEEGKYTYWYIGDTIQSIEENRGDTIFYYDPDFLDRPNVYYIYDSKKRIHVEYYYYNNEKTTYDWLEYNKSKGIFKALVTVEKYPDSWELERMSDLEKNTFLLKNRKYFIREQLVEYY